LAGLHRTYVSSVERGERNVTITTIERLAAALGVPMAELMPSAAATPRARSRSRAPQK
jgi:transcriptional regulator with XRE-family HTH domain